MGKYVDFCVKWDKDTESPDALFKRIIYSIIVRRIKGKKPAVLFLSGGSGEGKSLSALTLQIMILDLLSIPLEDYIKQYIYDINVNTPLEYPQKLKALLYDKRLKKIPLICMHEAREVVKAKNWFSFLNQAIADVNAMSRSIKRLCFIVISQFIRDISADIRYTLNFYVKVSRPIGKRARLHFEIMYKDDRDPDKPKIRKRKLRGYIVDKEGNYRIFTPDYIEIPKPPKEVIQIFEKMDYEAKTKIIHEKTERLIKEMAQEIEIPTKKIDSMVNHYIEHPDLLNSVGKRYRGKWKIKPQIKLMHDLTDSEVSDFQKKLNAKMQERGMI